MDKAKALRELKQEMQEDQTLPLRKGATQLVFGEGNPDADIYMLGEGPGYWEDLKGRPFVGQAGKLLDNLIESIGMQREDVYISNVVRYRPPNNRDPAPAEIAAFQPYVNSEIEIVNPKIIVTLGRFSMNKFLPNEYISKIHGKPRQVIWRGKSVTVIPMYHPAAALRNGQVMQQIREDFKIVREVLDRIELEQNKPKQMDLL